MSYLINRYILLALVSIAPQIVLSQVHLDTSYNFNSALLKIKKNYPNASIPVSRGSTGIQMEKDVIYGEVGIRQLTADLYYSTPQGNLRPGVVLIHGGGWKSGNKSMMALIAERLAIEGYAVMAPEYRLSLEAEYPAAVTDLKGAIQWFRKNSAYLGLDTSKIAVLGCSSGGQLAALIGTTNDSKIFEDSNPEASSSVHAIVDIDGILKFKHPESQEGMVASEWLGGTYDEVPAIWEEASALNHVNKFTPPTLFIGSKFPRFLAGHKEYMDQLNQYGIKVQKIIMEDAPHSFWLFDPWFEPTITYTIKFLNDTFKNS